MKCDLNNNDDVCRAVLLITVVLCMLPLSCKQTSAGPSKEAIAAIDLKKGELISCGPADKQFGTLHFEIPGTAEVKEEFNLGVKLLHSFEYDESEKVFASIIYRQPDCAMAYWGVAMSNFHPLWSPPSQAELIKGAKAIGIAQTIPHKSERETAYLDAIAAFYKDWDKSDHKSRCRQFEKAMEALYSRYKDDKEAAIFYALALNAAADPHDKLYMKQKKAGAILNALYADEPNHPGVIHYIIHTYDYPQLASLALPAARKYASVAPSSAHAQHMPSHIFTRMGLWDDMIRSNIASVSSAKCYASSAGIKGHWDEEFHAMDYLMYGYLQKGDNRAAKEQLDYLKSVEQVSPVNFKVAYAFAAIPARYVLENKLWGDAANLEAYYKNFPWEKFPWQKAIIHFTKILGQVHREQLLKATTELKQLYTLRDTLVARKEAYYVDQVQIQILAAEAWIRLKEGKKSEAVRLMTAAAEMEDRTEKHPVTPGEVLPAREMLADLYMELEQPQKALEAYEASLERSPKRFNGLLGAGLAAEKSGDHSKAFLYYKQLTTTTDPSSCSRSERVRAERYIGTHQ